MILVQLKGGLGNQMFQYAAGRSLAAKYQVPLLLDPESYESRQKGMYGLNGLNIQAGIATPADLAAFKQGTVGKVLNRVLPTPYRRVYKERHYEFDALLFQAQPPVYLKGYWQSWRYFEPVQETILSDFTFSIPFSPNILNKAAELQATESIAMHFRRGDYTDAATAAYHGICEPAYYDAAARYMLTRHPHAKFYIFTNDPAWVKDNLPSGITYEIVSGDLSHTQYEDLFLMSHCRHQIIANSSFSWWAAWLNTYKEKRVVAPAKWFAVADVDAKDLVPASWHRI
ncbi:alpha-1,2-fucosyltransferase [Chitinophaga sp. SYP-B3965]|uniref:alpha-1,2-fucosyltransferase n=1 Tax=Chitinophaga sp. SYP-B3965 TaxID=2663120 RepID=UPI001299AFAA|nr:alpha-1,2-fucosyltransferase [Chitinophaga sp. SYP-B3965]MRG44883.1 alpha-1,2-fucosyltransferase [Chitinophaga sp. SYP-B3965]